MTNLMPPSSPPRSRLHLARRSGIGACALAVLLGGLGHVIGWRNTGFIAVAAAAVAGLAFLVRGIRSRRSGGLPPGLRGLPPGLRGGRMPRIPGLPRGLGGGRMPRMPRAGMRGLPGGRANPMGRALGGMRGGPLRVPRSTARSRMPGALGRSARGTGAKRPGGLGRPGRAAGGTRRPHLPSRGRAAGSPAFRSPSARARAGSSPGSRGSWRPGSRSAGSRSGSSLFRRGLAGSAGSRSSAARRAASGTSRSGASAPVRGLRRLVPPRFRPARWGASAGSASGARRGFFGRRRTGFGYPATPRPGGSPGQRSRRRSRRSNVNAPPRVRVRRRWFRRPGRKVSGPKPVRTHRLRPFSGAWTLHHVRRYGRGRVRRKAARAKRRAARRLNVLRRRQQKTQRRRRGMRAFLISLRRKKNMQGTGFPVAAPSVVITPPRRAADPNAARRPRPARAPQMTPEPFAPFAGSAAHTPSPATGGTPMAASPQVTALVEAINDAFGKFDPETIVPDFEGFLEHFPEIFDAVKNGWQKVAAKVEDGLPINPAIPEAMRDMIPVIDGQGDAAREVFATFKRVHEKELDQHYNPRANEAAWNVGA